MDLCFGSLFSSLGVCAEFSEMHLFKELYYFFFSFGEFLRMVSAIGVATKEALYFYGLKALLGVKRDEVARCLKLD